MRLATPLLVLCVVFLVGGCATTQRTSGWDGDRLTQIANTTSSPTIKLWLNSRDNVIAEIPTAQAVTIAQASSRIQAAASFRVDRHFIANTDVVNAFATTNSKGERVVGITLGMMKALGDDKDAWAALLGHEIAHHVKGHGATRGEARAGAQVAGQAVATAVGFIPLGGPIASLLVSSAAGTATQMAVYGSYTRPQEEEADTLGMQWVVAAGYDPAGMRRLMQALARQSPTAIPAFLSTHPGSDERIRNVDSFIASRPTTIETLQRQPEAASAQPSDVVSPPAQMISSQAEDEVIICSTSGTIPSATTRAQCRRVGGSEVPRTPTGPSSAAAASSSASVEAGPRSPASEVPVHCKLEGAHYSVSSRRACGMLGGEVVE